MNNIFFSFLYYNFIIYIELLIMKYKLRALSNILIAKVI